MRMKVSHINQAGWGSIACLLGMISGSPVLADDIELFVGNNAGVANSEPNVLFIIDTSGSMSATVGTPPQYDPATTYVGACVNESMYWIEGSGLPPSNVCEAGSATSENQLDPTALKCSSALISINRGGASKPDFFARFDDSAVLGEWLPLSVAAGSSDPVECASDSGLDGDGEDTTRLWAADGENGPWTDNPAAEVLWGQGNTGTEYIVYSGNYLNWRASPESIPDSRISVVQDVAKNLLDSVSGVDVGLMRFSDNMGEGDAGAEGGMVVYAVEPVASAREPMKVAIDGLDASGFTPLSETLYEAGLYYLGRNVVYGLDSIGAGGAMQPSVDESRTGPDLERYDSPAFGAVCKKNFVVLLTDGAPTTDTGADDMITDLPGFEDATGNADCDGTGDGRCLDDMAAYLFNRDIDDDPSNGLQNVSTYTIGFAVDLPLLSETAYRGGGEYFTVDDVSGLEAALRDILREIREDNTTFAAPAVAIDAFNRTQSLDDLYYSVFQSDSTAHWNGNLKKYKFVNNQIVGVDIGESAIDATTGFFSDGSQSYWSDTADGGIVTRGGAASRLPDPVLRSLYTYTGTSDALTADVNQVSADNDALSNDMLGIGGVGDPEREVLIDWARGADVLDNDGDGDTGDARKIIGDPLHGVPAVVIYGGETGAPDLEDGVIYFGTNDGYLHAIDISTGDEVFAFIPQELLGNLPALYRNADSPEKLYGIDGNIQVLRQDLNGNGIIEPDGGDKIMLYFGMRRGGTHYYALDVTRRDDPRLMWELGREQLPRLGQTWSAPIISRVHINGAEQNDNQTVLIVGGGYATNQDNPGYSTDSFGNAIYMLDAESGALLWSAGPDDDNTLTLDEMTNAIPSNVRVIDLNNDQFADRMYVGDMGGRIWRFDIFNGQASADLVAGGVFASLGAADLDSPTVADNRRFYNAPDISLVPGESGSYLNIALGSGYRAHPLNTDTVDRFYSLRDFNPFNGLSQLDYEAIAPILDDDTNLIDVSNDLTPIIPAGASGWKLVLPGEKVLSESRTVSGTIVFTSFSPTPSLSACIPGRGKNKLYQISIFDASPVTNLDGIGDSDELTLQDRARELVQSGIAPTPTFLFPSPDAPIDGELCEGEECSCEGDDCGIPKPRCLVGLEACDVDFGNPAVRTFWTQKDIDEL